MRVFLTGATGSIGVPLVAKLTARGDVPVVVSRDAARAARLLPGAEIVSGNPQHNGDWMRSIDGCQAIVNLAGEPVLGRRWTAQFKEELRASRIETTRNLVLAVESSPHRPSVLASASAIGYYGNAPEGELTEKSGAGADWLAQLCVDWEAAALEAKQFGVRVALLRVGIALNAHSGVLATLAPIFRLGLGGPAGNGKQWMSWIHQSDLVQAFLFALDRTDAHGPINATAPEPVQNKTFSKCLAAALHRPCWLPIPSLAIRLRYGERADLLLGGQRVLPAKLEQLGFRFAHPRCAGAMRDACSPRSTGEPSATASSAP